MDEQNKITCTINGANGLVTHESFIAFGFKVHQENDYAMSYSGVGESDMKEVISQVAHEIAYHLDTAEVSIHKVYDELVTCLADGFSAGLHAAAADDKQAEVDMEYADTDKVGEIDGEGD